MRLRVNRDSIQVDDSCCGSPPWVVSSRYLDGRSNLPFVLQLVRVAQGVKHPLKLPRLKVPILGQPRVEVSDGGDELGGVHGSTQPLPRTFSRASFSAMPSLTSLRIRRPWSSDTPPV